MPGNTPRYQLPYPVVGDPVRDQDERFRALVDRLEIVLAAAHQPPLTPSDFDAAIAAIAELHAAPVTIANPVTASAGYTITAATLLSWQRVRQLALTVTNATGATITGDANGAVIGGKNVGTLIVGHRPVGYSAPFLSVGSVDRGYLWRVAPSGTVTLLGGGPNISWPNNTAVTIVGNWLI